MKVQEFIHFLAVVQKTSGSSKNMNMIIIAVVIILILVIASTVFHKK